MKNKVVWVVDDSKLIMTVKTGLSVNVDEELFVGYGNEHLCQLKIEYERLQRVVWWYYKYINL